MERGLYFVVATLLLVEIFQDELFAGYKREGIDPTPYYWYTDQVCMSVCVFVCVCMCLRVRAFPLSLCAIFSIYVA